MRFEYVYYSDGEERLYKNFAHVDVNNEIIDFSINLEIGYYEVKNGLVIVDDEILNGIKSKLIMEDIGKKSHLKKVNIKNYEHRYYLFIDGGYFICTMVNIVNDDDLKLTIDEYIIKRLLE